MDKLDGNLCLYTGITIINNADDVAEHKLYERITATYKDKNTYTMVLSYVTADSFKEIRYRVGNRAAEICSVDKEAQVERLVLILVPADDRAISRIESTSLRFTRELMEERGTRSYVLILTDYPNVAGYSHVDYSTLKKNFKVQLAR